MDLFLRRARDIVKARAPERHALVRRQWLAARTRLDVAERLDPKREIAAALPLYREGFIGLVGAAVACVEGAVETSDIADTSAAWLALERVWPKLGMGTPMTDVSPARELLESHDRIDAASRDGTTACFAIDHFARRLERVIEPRSARRLAIERGARIAALCAVPIALVAWKAPSMFAAENVALNKPVRLCSTHPDSNAPPSGEWLVNGKVERTYGAHTGSQEDPWMEIDLEKDVPIRRVIVYARGDGWFSDCIPLALELGTTPNDRHRVALRDTAFSQFNPWVTKLDAHARYVRLTKTGHGTCALSEVEVYSR